MLSVQLTTSDGVRLDADLLVPAGAVTADVIVGHARSQFGRNRHPRSHHPWSIGRSEPSPRHRRSPDSLGAPRIDSGTVDEGHTQKDDAS